MAKLEAYKKELGIGLDAFQQPIMLSGINAWVQEITNLLFMRKGSFPSCPDMGVDLGSYQYEFTNNVKKRLRDEIDAQRRIYLPDIPISSLDCQERDVPGQANPIILIIITFTINSKSIPVVIATNKSKNRIDFAVSM